MIPKCLPVLSIVALFSNAAVMERTASEKDAKTANFTPIFDGKTLEGWEGDKTLWRVEDGVIIGDSNELQHNEFLSTTRRFANFVLEFEFRVSGERVNSGVQFHSERDPDSTEIIGYQADIGQNYWGTLYDESRRRRILAQPEFAPEEQPWKESDWNTYRIHAEDGQIILPINGVETVNYQEPDGAIPQKGHIALQVHSGPPCKVEFRNLHLRELE